MLNDEEISNLWKRAKPVTSENAVKILGDIGAMPMSNGYLALLSLDIHDDGSKKYHLSISNPFGMPSFETAAAMAREILGECDQLMAGFRGVYHFVKDTNIDDNN